MSSVAYATEEILRVLVPAIGLAAFALVVPISGVILVILAILIFSYRQTMKAYPNAGGAYIVTKDNLGLLPAQVAGVALLTDYVLTVAVSVSAGTQAITSVVPGLLPYRVPLALGLIWLVAYGNLLGVRESGRIFAVPTYIFITSLFITIALGLYRVLTGEVGQLPTHQPSELPLGTSAALGIFIVLKAFASGGAALTGVEAISNGIPAFRKPEWRNAQKTLAVMGLVLGTSFLGVSFLAQHLRVIPVLDESKSVLAQIGEAIYGTSGTGHAMFLVLQAATMMILVLAANTSFADFPRLASFEAGDAFLPRQLTKRGHRLVFSNGILALAAAASVLVVAFKASVSALIPLYALGVYTAFTLSQAGMARRHLRLREPGWKFGLAVNGLGALATLAVDIVIATVKFTQGAWMVVLTVPILVFLFLRINKTYAVEETELMQGLVKLDHAERRRHLVVVVVDDFDRKTINAIEYAAVIRPSELSAVHLHAGDPEAQELSRTWALSCPSVVLDNIDCDRSDPPRCLKDYVLSRAGDNVDVTVMLPAPSRMKRLGRLVQTHRWGKLIEPLRHLDNVSFVVVKDPGDKPERRGGMRLAEPSRHRVVICVDRLDRSVVKAIHYARRLDASDISAFHAAIDPYQADKLMEMWVRMGGTLGIPLDVHECIDRNIPRVVTEHVREHRREDEVVTVVLPRRVYPRRLEGLLHDHTDRKIAAALSGEEGVQVAIVPYRMAKHSARANSSLRPLSAASEPNPHSLERFDEISDVTLDRVARAG